jgi:hypothetical protein
MGVAIHMTASAQSPGSFSNVDVTGTNPDIVFNQVNGNGFNTFTFRRNNGYYFAIGRSSMNNFYITRTLNNGQSWIDNTFVIQNNSGNVGIGALYPQYKLQIGWPGESINNQYNKIHIPGYYNIEGVKLGQYGNGAAGLEFINHVNLNESYGIRLMANVDQAPGLQIQYAGQTTSEAGLNYSTGIYMATNGHVGIGTLSPASYHLAVEGNLGARKVVVTQAAWADYVFDSSYTLRSLPEVAAFIKTNKHLPDVPAARTIEKDGLDVGDAQRLMMQKIEELTLYLIEQDKKIKVLEEKLAAQENLQQKKTAQ